MFSSCNSQTEAITDGPPILRSQKGTKSFEAAIGQVEIGRIELLKPKYFLSHYTQPRLETGVRLPELSRLLFTSLRGLTRRTCSADETAESSVSQNIFAKVAKVNFPALLIAEQLRIPSSRQEEQVADLPLRKVGCTARHDKGGVLSLSLSSLTLTSLPRSYEHLQSFASRFKSSNSGKTSGSPSS